MKIHQWFHLKKTAAESHLEKVRSRQGDGKIIPHKGYYEILSWYEQPPKDKGTRWLENFLDSWTERDQKKLKEEYPLGTKVTAIDMDDIKITGIIIGYYGSQFLWIYGDCPFGKRVNYSSPMRIKKI